MSLSTGIDTILDKLINDTICVANDDIVLPARLIIRLVRAYVSIMESYEKIRSLKTE